MTAKFLRREMVILFGGLDGTVRYYGVGMTTAGREKEAAIGQMLASTAGLEERETAVGPVELLRRPGR